MTIFTEIDLKFGSFQQKKTRHTATSKHHTVKNNQSRNAEVMLILFVLFIQGLVLDVFFLSDLSEEKSYFRKLEHCWKGVFFATKSDYFVFRKALFSS